MMRMKAIFSGHRVISEDEVNDAAVNGIRNT